ncbi:MAG TPA: molybdopterin-dependent oxidoreductase, partial [Gemmataceae bacterium]|nr:molybdopterin-dependent oxidoreductase [Gemmataceae bacterium]
MPGLGTSYGRGGATTFAMDMKNADSVLIMGSNMAECHPVAFRWVMQAKTRANNPATIIHADPRFTRTSAMANVYAPLRAGSDIAFLGALINHALRYLEPIFLKDESRRTPRERFFADYLWHYTNAATLVSEDFKDTEEDNYAGLFSGFDAGKRRYDVKKWRYDSEPPAKKADEPGGKPGEGRPHSFTGQVGRLVGPPPKVDPTGKLQHPRCVFQVLKRHYARYTPEMVEEVCGTPRETFLKVAEALLENAGPDRTGAVVYAVGWTQHTTGVQMIRAAAVLQLLLGNVGRPGGGILALRGHATIQGSTDIATLFNLLPGYLPAPDARRKNDTLEQYIDTETSATSYWSNFPKFIVSELKAWFGDDATAENDYGYDYLPKNIGDHSHMPMMIEMSKGTIKGLFALGQNPAVGGQNASFQRQALAKLDWLVVRDLYETETASFWKDSPEVKNGTLKTEDIATEVFFLPAAAVAEMEGSFTNTQRLVQWHEKALDPPGDCRSDIWFTYHLGRRLKELYKDSKEKRDRPILSLVWDYLDDKANERWRVKDEPSAALVLKEINGYVWPAGSKSPVKDGKPLPTFADLKDDGTTTSGAWIYTGIYKGGENQAANRKGDDWVALGWGFSWPANRRLMYNRCSADPQGNPWPKEARLARQFTGEPGGSSPRHRGYVYWDPSAADGKGQWVGLDVPDFVVGKAPNTPAKKDGVGLEAHDGASPFIMKADGKGWLFVPNGLVDGPMPTHYEPYESPIEKNPLYGERANPVTIVWKIPGNPYAGPGSPEYPHVLSTYRLTEHHLSGVMSRWLPWLAELQ